MLHTAIEDIQHRSLLVNADFQSGFKRERNVAYQNAKTDGHEEHRLEVLGNGKVNEDAADNRHHHITDFHIAKARVFPKDLQILNKKV